MPNLVTYLNRTHNSSGMWLGMAPRMDTNKISHIKRMIGLCVLKFYNHLRNTIIFTWVIGFHMSSKIYKNSGYAIDLDSLTILY